ncbi:hypothetical protein ACIGCM_09170 [Pseudomonas sp. NPDC078700]|uniref:hypothetical protein n=1 Tax=Pseudomonas sp. NPDC078700 TaxID=3364424 RepID=UPI0037CA3340
MNIRISPLSKAQGSRWQVSFAGQQVSFASEAEARSFVSTLQARLQAPHHLPTEAQRLAG